MLGLAIPSSWWIDPHGALAASAWGIWGPSPPPLPKDASSAQSTSFPSLSSEPWHCERSHFLGPFLWKSCFLHPLLIGDPLPGSVEGYLSDIFPSSYQSSGLPLSPSDLPLLPPVPQKGEQSRLASCCPTSGRNCSWQLQWDFCVYFLTKSLVKDLQSFGALSQAHRDLPTLFSGESILSCTPPQTNIFLKFTGFRSWGLLVFLGHHVVRKTR